MSTRVKWDEVEEAAQSMFHVWVDGGEHEWAKACWRHLSAAGLTPGDTVLERTLTLVRLVALAYFYHQFCLRKWDENTDKSPEHLTWDLEIDRVALGMLAASAGLDGAGIASSRDLVECALETLIETVRPQIFECLSKAYGDPPLLYARMSRTQYPRKRRDEEDHFDTTGSNMWAYEYVTGGFRD